MAEECRKFKRRCKILTKRLKDAGCKYRLFIQANEINLFCFNILKKKVLRIIRNNSKCSIKIMQYLNAFKDEGDDAKEHKDRSYILRGSGECVVDGVYFH